MSIIGTTVTITGEPVCSFEFIGLPSTNTHYNKHFRPRAVATNELRLEAREEAKWWAFMNNKEGPIVTRAFVLVKIWVPHEGIMDIHNTHIKPLLDGFSDAGVWEDDEWAFVPLVAFMWAGVATHPPRSVKLRRTVLEIHFLHSIIENGEHLTLPRGRTSLETKTNMGATYTTPEIAQERGQGTLWDNFK